MIASLTLRHRRARRGTSEPEAERAEAAAVMRAFLRHLARLAAAQKPRQGEGGR